MPPLLWVELAVSALTCAFVGFFFYHAMVALPIHAGERDRLRVLFAAPRTNALLLGFAVLGVNGLTHDLLALTGWFALDGRYELAHVGFGIYAGALLAARRRARLCGVLPVGRRAEG